MKKIVTFGVALLLALAIVATGTAGALLSGTTFGFPSMVQSGMTTAYNQDIVSAFNNECSGCHRDPKECVCEKDVTSSVYPM